MLVRLALAGLLTILAAGCGGEKESKTSTSTAAKSSSAADAVVDVVTRRDAVEAGKRAKSAIQEVQTRRQQDFEDALGEKP